MIRFVEHILIGLGKMPWDLVGESVLTISSDKIFDKARLVNCALMAKIHTVYVSNIQVPSCENQLTLGFAENGHLLSWHTQH